MSNNILCKNNGLISHCGGFLKMIAMLMGGQCGDETILGLIKIKIS
jgi:hypothetical protein